MVDIGSSFPPFELRDQDGGLVSSQSLSDSWFLLYWYPKADTPGCTAQAQGLRDQIEAFEELGCVVLGASFDEPASNQAFREKYRLPFRLLSDTGHDVAVALGVVESHDTPYPSRIAHLVGPDGVVVKRYAVEDPEFFAEDVLDDLEAALD